MTDFKIGDYVYAGDWAYGEIVEIDENVACIEFTTPGGGGCMHFDLSELTPFDIREFRANELLRDWKSLVQKAKDYGMDIRFSVDSVETLELYYHEDYPDVILVDKAVSCYRYESRKEN